MCDAHMKSAPRAYVSEVICPRKQIIVMPLVLFLGMNSAGCVIVLFIPMHGQ